MDSMHTDAIESIVEELLPVLLVGLAVVMIVAGAGYLVDCLLTLLQKRLAVRQERAANRLASLLSNEDVRVRKRATRKLLQIGMPRAIPPLLALLANERAEVRESAAAVLDKLHWEAVTHEQMILYLLARKRWTDLIALLVEARAEVREDVVAVLRRFHWEPETVEQRIFYLVATKAWAELLPLLPEARAEVRENVAAVLRRFHWEPETVEQRIFYLVATKAWDELLALLADGRAEVGENVAAVLDQFHWELETFEQRILYLVARKGWAELLPLLPEARAPVRRNVVAVLDKLHWEPETVEQRMFYLVASEAWGELIATGEQSIRRLLGVLAKSDPATQRTIIRAWVEKGTPHTDILIKEMQDDDLQQYAAVLLGIARDPATVEPLIGLLRDKSLSVRETAAYVLGLIGDASAIGALQALWRATDVEHLWLRRAARWALHRIDPSQSPGGEPDPVWLPWFHEIWVPKSWGKAEPR